MYTLEAHEYHRSTQTTVLRVFNSSQAMSSVCMWFFCLSCWMLHWRAYLWEYCQMPTCFVCGWQQVKKRRAAIKRTCVTFLPSLAKDGGHWTIWNYVSIVSIHLCEIKYCYCGLWWMERVSQISVTSPLKTFPKWPYQEFLKRCLLRIKRSNWLFLCHESLNLFYFRFTSHLLLWFFKYATSVNTLVAKYRQQNIAQSDEMLLKVAKKQSLQKKGICYQII